MKTLSGRLLPVCLLMTACTARTVAPDAREAMLEYEVLEGDSLFAIAEKFGIAPETVLLSNPDQLLDDPRSLESGLTLWIPPEDGAVHTWRSTDSWERVGVEYGIAPETILEWKGNGLQEFSGRSMLPELQPGSRIFIPGGSRPFFNPADAVPRDAQSE